MRFVVGLRAAAHRSKIVEALADRVNLVEPNTSGMDCLLLELPSPLSGGMDQLRRELGPGGAPARPIIVLFSERSLGAALDGKPSPYATGLPGASIEAMSHPVLHDWSKATFRCALLSAGAMECVSLESLPSTDLLEVIAAAVARFGPCLAARKLRHGSERLHVQLESSDVGLWRWDPQSDELHCDPNLTRLFGLEVRDGPSRLSKYLERIHPEERGRVQAAIRTTLETGELFDQVHRIVLSDGRVRWLHARGTVEYDRDRRAVAFTGIGLDVTTRYSAEAQIREREAMLRSLYESTVFMMGVVEIPDDDSDILHIFDSPATHRLFGAAPGSMERKFTRELGVPSPVKEQWIRCYRESERLRREVRFEYVHPTESGPLYLVSVVSCIGRFATGTRFSYVTEDVTARKTAEQRLRDRDTHLSLAMAASLTIAFDWDIRNNRIWRLKSAESSLPETGEGWDTFEHVESLVHPEDRPGFLHSLNEALHSEEGRYRSEHRIVRPDGEVRWLFETGTVEFDAEHRPLRLLGISQDVSDRRRTQQNMQRQAQLLDISHEPIMLWVPGPHAPDHARSAADGGASRACSAIEEWNLGAERLYGFTRSEVIGRDIHELLQTRSALPLGRIAKRLEEFGDWTGELRQKAKDGHEIVVESRQQLIRSGQQCWVLESTRDITERKRAEVELMEADRRKDHFIAVLAHELRNPLAPVRNAIELLRRLGPVEPRIARARDVIDRQVRHMTRLVEDLLDVSRIARGKLALQREICDLAVIVRQTAEDYRASLESEGLSLVAASSSAPLWVDGDPMRLAQMVGNILQNAGRFTPKGGTIKVRTARDDATGSAMVSVSDTGIGIEPSFLTRLFDAFSQADQDLARSKGGLGLGLALTRGLAELHGGCVEAFSEGAGRGSTFTLRFPLQASYYDVKPSSESPPSSGRGLRLLIVEDNEDAAETLRELMQLYGYQVRVAFDGVTGVKAALEYRPDVVISDLGLPGKLDGYAVARTLREEPKLAAVSLIALSGYSSEDARRRSREAGFEAHFAKPPDIAQLERAVADLAARHRAGPGPDREQSEH